MADTQDVQQGDNIRSLPVRNETVEVVNGPDDVDYEASRPKRLSAALLNERPEEIPEFKMHQLSVEMGFPVTAKVRLVNLTDRALLTELPTNVREQAQKLFFSTGNANQKKKSAVAEMENTAERIRKVAQTYGCAGFVDPKLVLTQAEEDEEKNILWVQRIPLHDLQEFTRICEGDDQLASRRLERFSE